MEINHSTETDYKGITFPTIEVTIPTSKSPTADFTKAAAGAKTECSNPLFVGTDINDETSTFKFEVA